MFPGEDVNSTVLLQRYLTGLRPTISRQIFLCKKPNTLQQAITNATEVELALSFDTTSDEAKVHVVTANQPAQNEFFTKLQQVLESVSKQLEQLESKLQEAPHAQGRPHATGGGNRQQNSAKVNRRPRPGDSYCFLCFEEGHWKQDCPLNFDRPARRVGCWSERR